jgi:hypothetical protein
MALKRTFYRPFLGQAGTLSLMNSTHMGACGEFTSGTIHIFLAAGTDAFFVRDEERVGE